MNESIGKCEVHPQKTANPWRGTVAAIMFGLLGLLATILVMGVITAGRWIVVESNEFDRSNDLASLRHDVIGPMMGVGLVFAASGWATYMPPGTYRFASTLAIIFAISVIGWLVLGSMNLTPPRYKSIEHPFMYPSEAFVFFTPPIVAALVLTLIRHPGTLPEVPNDTRSSS